jgi:P27 family predicted phage terminase small subunit
MRGRPPKPLAVKLAEGSRIREDRINREAPDPPRGPLDPPDDVSEPEKVVWRHLVSNQARGVFRPLDTQAMRQYCWSVAQAVAAQAELRTWAEAPKKTGETPFFKKAKNGALVLHPLFALIKDLREQILKSECLLGLNPVARERIHAGVQADLFENPNDPWAALELPGEHTAKDEEKAN